jgi:hypothetical protein
MNIFICTTLKLAMDSHNRPSLTFSTPKCYKIHQGVIVHVQYEYHAIFWKIFPIKNYFRYMVVQYLKELMSIYKGTSMKLLMKKSEFLAVEFRLWNNITMAFYLNILQVHKSTIIILQILGSLKEFLLRSYLMSCNA